MYLSEILNLIGNYNYEDKKFNKITIDSREITSNDIFICINTGYKYIEDAIKRGAICIIVEKDINCSILTIKVNDTKKTLGIIAKYIRSKYKGKVIAITGSNGKTTTKELLSYVLSSKYKVLKNIGTNNNHIGVPSTILKLDNSYDYLVLELGTNHIGEIKYLSDIVNPDIAVITNIGFSHIGNFESIDNIFKEKMDIVKDSTILFVNGEDKYLKNTNGIKVYSNEYKYKCNIEYLQINYNLVFKVCEYLNMNINEVYERIKSFKNCSSRMEIIKNDNITIIDDSYNASYESVVSGLNSLNKYNNKFIILGDMLELGNYSYKLHSNLQSIIDSLGNYYLITIGNYTKVLNSNLHFDNVDDLIKHLYSINYSIYDVIYIKGAHSIKLYNIVPILKKILQIA